MSNSRPFTYNPTHISITGTTLVGDISVGVDPLRYDLNPGGLKWYMGPDEDGVWTIAVPHPSGISAADGSTAYVGYYQSINLSTSSLIGLVNVIGSQNFTTFGEAISWLDTQEYWYTSGGTIGDFLLKSTGEYITINDSGDKIYIIY